MIMLGHFVECTVHTYNLHDKWTEKSKDKIAVADIALCIVTRVKKAHKFKMSNKVLLDLKTVCCVFVRHFERTQRV